MRIEITQRSQNIAHKKEEPDEKAVYFNFN